MPALSVVLKPGVVVLRPMPIEPLLRNTPSSGVVVLEVVFSKYATSRSEPEMDETLSRNDA